MITYQSKYLDEKESLSDYTFIPIEVKEDFHTISKEKIEGW